MRILLMKLLVVASVTLNAQQISFKKMLIDGYSNWGMSVIETDSNYVLIGEGRSLHIIGNDSFALWKIKFHKFDHYGNHLASNNVGDFPFNWSNGGRGNAIAISDGNFVIAGFREDTISRYPALIKFDANMDTVWVKRLVGNGNWVFNDVKETSDKGLIIAGWEDYYMYQYANIKICKIDSTGNFVWCKKNSKPNANYPSNIEILADGGFLVAGIYHVNNRFDDRTGYLAKFDYNGSLIWDTLFPTQEIISAMDKLKDGKFLAIGYKNDPYNAKPQITKFDSDGNIIWKKRFDLHKRAIIVQCDETSNGDIVCAGTFRTDSIYGDIGWVLWLDSLGDLKKEQAYMYWPLNNGFMGDGVSFYDIRQTKDGGYIIGGSVDEPARMGIYANQFMLLKLDSAGCVVDDCGFLTSIYEREYLHDNTPKIYPNPTNGILTIEIEINSISDFELKLFDFLGRKVFSQNIANGKNELNLDLPKGLYLYHIGSLDKITSTGKILIN